MVKYKRRVERSVLRVAYLWKMWIKKNGGDIEYIYSNKIRSSLTYAGIVNHDQAEKIAMHKYLKPFIKEYIYREFHIKN